MQGAWMNFTYRKDLVVSDPQNFGANVAPDAAPTFKVFADANDTPIATGTFVQRSGLTNHFRASFVVNTANGFVMWQKCVLRAEGLIHTLAYSAEHEFVVIPPLALDYNIAWAGKAAAGGDATHVVLDATASTADDGYTDMRVVKSSIVYGVESRPVFGYVGATKTALVEPAWFNNPAAGDFITIYADAMGTAQSLSDTELARFQFLLGAGVRNDISLDTLAAASGLTPQQVRDALKLAPTAGSPAAGSTDAVTTATNTAVSALNNVSQPQVQAAVSAAITSYGPSRPADAMALTSGERSTLTGIITGTLALKRNTAAQYVPFFMRDITNVLTGLAGTPVVTVERDGSGVFDPVSGTVNPVSGSAGDVDFFPSAQDLNGTCCKFRAVLTGAVTDRVVVYTHA